MGPLYTDQRGLVHKEGLIPADRKTVKSFSKILVRRLRFQRGRRFIFSVRRAKALHCGLAIGASMFFCRLSFLEFCMLAGRLKVRRRALFFAENNQPKPEESYLVFHAITKT